MVPQRGGFLHEKESLVKAYYFAFPHTPPFKETHKEIEIKSKTISNYCKTHYTLFLLAFTFKQCQ